ncbi:potassium-transporting ATPase subunit C [Leptospira sarikeiensis]|uniref:Potassium-transporting ATPase KdpC subunit n=1 Tax=Leptospira sarikeiensis TaxID=2484943 RepID=A0A4R9KDK4_9LEPT|nr:potassium-transporting ATPase subunit C [Leptospira sarikeiensis]TGL64025.1 potassium-transporting ATPase subunit C [Leptospira sarikeiensis]
MIRAFLQLSIWTLICGIFYPALVYGFSKLSFPKQSSGSLVELDGRVIGSELLAQSFESEKYFHSRPSAVEFNSSSSGASNLGPTSSDLAKKVEERRKYWIGRGGTEPVPAELLYASASGLDPHLSPEAIRYQIPLIVKDTGIGDEGLILLNRFVKESVEFPEWGLFGSSKINVLKLNLKLKSIYSEEKFLKNDKSIK